MRTVTVNTAGYHEEGYRKHKEFHGYQDVKTMESPGCYYDYGVSRPASFCGFSDMPDIDFIASLGIGR